MEEDAGDDGAAADADGAFDYATLADAMDASESRSDDDSDGQEDEEEDSGIDGLGGGPGGDERSGLSGESGMHHLACRFLEGRHANHMEGSVLRNYIDGRSGSSLGSRRCTSLRRR